MSTNIVMFNFFSTEMHLYKSLSYLIFSMFFF
jgi:hypothetical protein